MIRRPRRSLPATLVALVLLAVCVGVVVAVVQSLLSQTPFLSLDQLLATTSSQQWSSPATIVAAIVLAVLGLVLLVAAVSAGTPTVLPLAGLVDHDGEPAADAGVRRRSLVTDLTAAARTVPGVSSASVAATGARVTATVTVAASDPDAVPDQVRERLEARLAEIGPAARPTVRIKARPDRNT